jgi:hypothetical protein
MSEDFWLLVLIVLLVILFAGDPDLMDGIIDWMRCR